MKSQNYYHIRNYNHYTPMNRLVDIVDKDRFVKPSVGIAQVINESGILVL